jgi:hypothetical protein
MQGGLPILDSKSRAIGAVGVAGVGYLSEADSASAAAAGVAAANGAAMTRAEPLTEAIVNAGINAGLQLVAAEHPAESFGMAFLDAGANLKAYYRMEVSNQRVIWMMLSLLILPHCRILLRRSSMSLLRRLRRLFLFSCRPTPLTK